MSLIPSSRLNWLSTKSPIVAQMTKATPSTMPIHHGPWMSSATTSTPVMMPATSEPANPSHDLFGLTAGAIGWEPNITPAAYPPTSLATTQSMNAMM